MKPSVRISGGNPNGIPDFKPLNPWGRPMPEPERPPRPPLWQVHVSDRSRGRVIPVGPRMGKEYAEMFRLAISNQIHLGAERRWANPHLVMMST